MSLYGVKICYLPGFCYQGGAMPVKQVITEGNVPVKMYTDEVKAGAREQLVNVSELPFIHHHVAAMPDVPLGIGATAGSVIPIIKI
jgi:tRNA-splicing ligase RtcB